MLSDPTFKKLINNLKKMLNFDNFSIISKRNARVSSETTHKTISLLKIKTSISSLYLIIQSF